MTIEWQQLDNQPRLLMEAKLKPAQGHRFQPTGFPDLGAAVYQDPEAGDSRIVLVESAQSVANRMEAVCWDEAAAAPHLALNGMPYVSVTLWDSGNTTNSLLEAHRLNSPYIMNDDGFKAQMRAEANLSSSDNAIGRFDRSALAKAAFKYDPGSVLHGVFLEKIAGLARLQRCLSGFIEATGADVADLGGVKNDRVAPDPKALKNIGLTVDASDGYGNVIYRRTEYTATRITAYFSIDLAQIRAYRLGKNAERFLVTLALWKVRQFLYTGLRLRTACDFDVAQDLVATRPEQFTIPLAAALETDLPHLIAACTSEGLFADPPVTRLTFQRKR